jgi:hypothetical protein
LAAVMVGGVVGCGSSTSSPPTSKKP